jgi:hypothetical protein
MALPLIIFFFLIACGVALFIFGGLNKNAGAGFAFLSVSGVFFILTGLLLWTGGLQLGTLSAWDTTTETIVASYETLTFAANPEIVILSWFLTIGGFVPIVLAFASAISHRRETQSEAVSEWAI